MTAQEYSALYATMRESVIHLLRKRTGWNGELAEELSQQTWLKVWKHRERYRPDMGKAEDWIYQIARTTAISYYRREKIRREQNQDWQDIELTDDQSNRNTETSEANDRLTRLREVLPTELHPILDAWLSGGTDADIGQALSVPVGSVAYHKNRVREYASRMG
ncbi:RpoE DNA-directed RNA polymerase specialized sigma subunit, sigma24 homolog [uncultured Caudovirales phage]|uniref:RpoE DNA-directed RNA polymerase specialized sigma subunit, sigma24 homolog n=1 Tax=uncultured Caudovirales phage TaxID=2100421 RepID=A0A6J5P041_9CAUD|nr:RpoE DNA-directed RNA polymerase specialized sigma subunit, sigma24 homolog [uncultured Caudovirales phage]